MTTGVTANPRTSTELFPTSENRQSSRANSSAVRNPVTSAGNASTSRSAAGRRNRSALVVETNER